MAELVCPKCQSPMRSYERSGLQVDQCSGCRGVFLDRGELERLIDAEGEYYERGGGRGDDARRSEHREEHRDEHRGGSLSDMGGLGGLLGGGKREHYGGHGHRKKHKRESFLSDLFD